MLQFYPIKMNPAFKDYIWGGDRLKREWGKVSSLAVIAEAWELSGHKNGQSIAGNGELMGLSLTEIVEAWGKASLGDKAKDSDRFPILIKLIDSKQKLSIQVHPDDRYALANENELGKTEMWYVIDADEGSGILCGFSKDLSKEEYAQRINENTLTEVLNFVPVKKGDTFFIAPGTVHAICEGLLIAEIQQNSDVTYRVYDYGRIGADGKQRPLHIEKALDVSRTVKEIYDGKPIGETKNMNGYTETLLAECGYFIVYEISVQERYDCYIGNNSFSAFTFLEGNGTIEYSGGKEEFVKGETFFLPAGLGEVCVTGTCKLLVSGI
jgi:mannose-6-phosphate isomerase